MSTSASPPSSAPLGKNGLQDTAEWEKLFQAPVEEDDPIWKDYLAAAAVFDTRMIDQWNKVIDGVLVYVALFLSVLAAFVVVTAQQFKPDAADISNKLLVAMYKNQLAYMQNRSPDTIDTDALFQQDTAARHEAVVYNSLLYADLALSVVVSMIALFAKLWVINYDHQVNSSGSPYKRAMRRQEAYSGVLAWRMKEIINSLPFLLLIAVFMLGVFIYQSISSEQITIGYVVGAMLLLGFVFLILASVAAAFIPACPFNSSLTTLIKLFFKFFPGHYLPKWMRNADKFLGMTHALLRIFSVGVASILVIGVMVFCVLRYNSGAYYAFICFPFAAGVSIFGDLPRSYERPPKYGIEYWIFLASIVIAPFVIAASYYSDTRFATFVGLFSTGCALLLLFTIFGSQLFKFTPETRETDAVAWLLDWTASQEPSYFRKAGEISKKPKDDRCQHPKDENYDHRKAFLLTSLLPLLSSLITSKIQYRDSNQEETKDLEIYVACLAQLSNFEPFGGSIWKNQSALVHPENVESLVESLEKILGVKAWESNSLLRSAAQDALKHYKKTKGEESV